MKSIIHITGEMSTIEYDSTVPCVIDTIREFLTMEEFKTHLNKELELLTKAKKVHGEIGLITNINLIVAFPEEYQTWIMGVWTLRAAQAGIQHIAMVSINFFDEVSEKTLNGITFRNFKDVESAKAWLKNSLKKAVITVL